MATKRASYTVTFKLKVVEDAEEKKVIGQQLWNWSKREASERLKTYTQNNLELCRPRRITI